MTLSHNYLDYLQAAPGLTVACFIILSVTTVCAAQLLAQAELKNKKP